MNQVEVKVDYVFDMNELAYYGAREKIRKLLEKKHEIDKEISALKSFLRSGKKKFVAKVAKKKRKLSPAQRRSMLANVAKARAAYAAKRKAENGK